MLAFLSPLANLRRRRMAAGAPPTPAPQVARSALHLARQQRGSVMITFAVSLIPATMFVGAAVDYSRASSAKTKLDAAADTAALAAVSKKQIGGTASAAEAAARNAFDTGSSTLTGVTVGTVSTTVTDVGMTRTAVVSYAAVMPTAFLTPLGIRTMSIAGSSTAAAGLPTYMDFYLLLDNTPSMGVGAKSSDISRMVNNTSDRCAFACHDLSASPNDYYGLAKRLGVEMRIDVVRKATQQLMITATETRTETDQFRMAIYTFGSAASSRGLTTIQSLTPDLETARTSASAIDLMTVPYQNYASDTLTDFGNVLTGVNSAISAPGTGRNSSSPQKYLFFVSDGVADRALGSPACSRPTNNGTDPRTRQTYRRCQEPLDTSFCTTMKNRGIKIAVLYTTYLPLPTNDWYNDWISPFSSQIAANMKSCASPDLYFEVSPTEGISEAMTALFQKAVQQTRLTR
jgi:Flp pilus assembly protein TadG